jgi:hypothetical protein
MGELPPNEIAGMHRPGTHGIVLGTLDGRALLQRSK